MYRILGTIGVLQPKPLYEIEKPNAIIHTPHRLIAKLFSKDFEEVDYIKELKLEDVLFTDAPENWEDYLQEHYSTYEDRPILEAKLAVWDVKTYPWPYLAFYARQYLEGAYDLVDGKYVKDEIYAPTRTTTLGIIGLHSWHGVQLWL